MKVIQFQVMPNDECWQGKVLGLGDDGITYISEHDQNGSRWVEYIQNQIVKSNEQKAIELMRIYIDWVIDVDEEELLSESNCKGHDVMDEVKKIINFN